MTEPEARQAPPPLALVAFLACLWALVMPLIGLGMAGGPNDSTAAWLLFTSPAVAVAGMACAWTAAARAARVKDQKVLGFTKVVFMVGAVDLVLFLLLLVVVASAGPHLT